MAQFHAIIAGASRGLGRSIAQEFRARGENLAWITRSRPDLEAQAILWRLPVPDPAVKVSETQWESIR